MPQEQYGELLAVVAMARETNALSTAMGVPIGVQFQVNRKSNL